MQPGGQRGLPGSWRRSACGPARHLSRSSPPARMTMTAGRAARRALLDRVAAEVLGDRLGRGPQRGPGVVDRGRPAEAALLAARAGPPAVAGQPGGGPLGQAAPAGRVVDRDPRGVVDRRRALVGLALDVGDAWRVVVGEVVTGAVGAVPCPGSSAPECGRAGAAGRRAAQHAVLELEEAEHQAATHGDQDHRGRQDVVPQRAARGGAPRTGANGTARLDRQPGAAPQGAGSQAAGTRQEANRRTGESDPHAEAPGRPGALARGAHPAQPLDQHRVERRARPDGRSGR